MAFFFFFNCNTNITVELEFVYMNRTNSSLPYAFQNKLFQGIGHAVI